MIRQKKYMWRDSNGNYLPSKCATKFLDKLEMLFRCHIEREFAIKYGTSPNKVRYYDGRYKNYVIELDGKWFHRTDEQKRNDRFKDAIAERHNFKMLRLPLNSTKDIDAVLLEYMPILQEIFGDSQKDSKVPNIIDKIFVDFD